MMHFVRTFSITCALSVRLIVIDKVRNYEKVLFTKNMFENGWWGGDASPISPSGSAPDRGLNSE